MSRQKITINKLPKKVKVLGRTITVVRGPMKEEEFGEYKQHKYQITINNKLNHTEAMQTLFHEILHASLHISGISQLIPVPADGEDTGVDLEEGIVVCLENAISHAVDIKKFL